jgi:hypothetical protein
MTDLMADDLVNEIDDQKLEASVDPELVKQHL